MALHGSPRNVFRPEHREMRRRHLRRCRQVEPDLEEFQRVGPRVVEQRKHLRVHDAATRGQPLHIAAAIARRRAERIRMVDETLAHDRDRLESAMRVGGKARHRLAVVHAPAIRATEVLADRAAGERGVRTKTSVAARIGVIVVDAEQERIGGLPRETQRADTDHGSGHGLHLGWHSTAAVRWAGALRPPGRLHAGAIASARNMSEWQKMRPRLAFLNGQPGGPRR